MIMHLPLCARSTMTGVFTTDISTVSDLRLICLSSPDELFGLLRWRRNTVLSILIESGEGRREIVG